MVWGLLAATMLGALFAGAQTTAGIATLEIDLSKSLHSVSPTFYGLMTEEINYSDDGGLYAGMVRNRTFLGQENAPPAHWFLVQEGYASAVFKVDSTQGPSEALRRSLLIEVAKADRGSMAARCSFRRLRAASKKERSRLRYSEPRQSSECAGERHA
jgi:alpha-N-arabinofuranosidase